MSLPIHIFPCILVNRMRQDAIQSRLEYSEKGPQSTVSVFRLIIHLDFGALKLGHPFDSQPLPSLRPTAGTICFRNISISL